MKRTGVLAALAASALALGACGGGGGGDTATGGATGGTDAGATDATAVEGLDGYTIAHIVNGYLGDQGFFDDAESGVQALVAAGATGQTLQADPNNPAQWKANIESVSGSNDVIIAGTSQMVDILNEVAPKYPDQNYILYDAEVDQPNVASMIYAQNEGSFLAGVLAALVTTDTANFPMANEDKIVGMVGGMDIPVINDFAVGFEAGVHAVDPDIEVLISYAGSFADSQKGYDQAAAMYQQGADVVFQVAGGTGIGVLQAAADNERYAIGVDSNQNQVQPGFVLASMLKYLGGSLEQAVQADVAGELAYGETTIFGLSNDGVGLDFADNEGIVPDDVIAQIEDYKQQVIDGTIEVPTTR